MKVQYWGAELGFLARKDASTIHNLGKNGDMGTQLGDHARIRSRLGKYTEKDMDELPRGPFKESGAMLAMPGLLF